jgi:predicted ATPase/signal transduction histidine kinase
VNVDLKSGSPIREGYRFDVRRCRGQDGRGLIVKSVRKGPLAEQSSDLLRHEYQLLCGLDVNGVCRPVALDRSDGALTMVVEDAGPQNLAELIGGRPLPVERFLDLAIAMAAVVRAISGRNVVHRDICPDNFVVGADGRSVVLVDFESATTVSSFLERGGVPAELAGTIAFMAPEQTGRMKRLVDARADLYSLGATYYAMLTGAPPFPAPDPLASIHDHLARMPFPPSVLNAAVPPMLSEIVLRLLAKMPEHRYQTAEALLADLEEARRRWRVGGSIAPFELGQKDVPYGLRLHVRLYGREHAQERLLRAFERTSSGARELVTITGRAGIGKSALLEQVRRDVAERGRVVDGKCELLGGNRPYAPFVDALGHLVEELGEQPPERLEPLRARLSAAVAPNASVLLDVLPALERLLGPQPAAPPVGPLEAENRFLYTFAAFIRALAADEIPLVLMIDDVQWADAASLKLLAQLAADLDLGSTLLIVTWRSAEVEPDHPVERLLTAARHAGTPIESLALEPLDVPALVEFLADVFAVERAQAQPLAEILWRKTEGNPFFVHRLLGHLYRAGLIVRDFERATWVFSLEEVAAAPATEHVAALLESSLRQLSPRDRDVLTAAACIGNQFGLDLLAAVCDQAPDEVAAALWAPLEEGLLAPASGRERRTQAKPTHVELRTALAPQYRFAHDRIQQAACELADERRRKQLHLRIGRVLLARDGDADHSPRIAEIVDQLDRADELLSAAERAWLARLNLRAGEKVASQSAHASALGYFQKGLSLLPPEPWRLEHELWFALQSKAAAVASWIGEYERSQALVADGLAHADGVIEKSEFYAVAVSATAMRPETLHEALRLGGEALHMLGIDLPFEDLPRAAREEMDRCRDILNVALAHERPPATNAETALNQARLRLLSLMASPAWFLDANLCKVVVARAVQLFEQVGKNAQTAFMYASYATMLAIDERYPEAYQLSVHTQELLQRFPNPAEEARVMVLLGGHIRPWGAPVAESIPLLRRGFRLGVEGGELLYAAHNLADLVWVLLFVGTGLNDVLGEIDSVLSFYRKSGHELGVQYVVPARQAARCLKGTTRSTSSFDDQDFDEAQFLVEASANGLGLAYHHQLRLQVAYLLGHLGQARQHALEGVASLDYFRSVFPQVDYFFYAALVATALLDHATSPEEQASLGEELRGHLRRLQRWAMHAPENYQHKALTVAAELARTEGRSTDALSLFIEAIEAAGRSRFQHDAALINERCARFLVARGDEQAATLFLEAARDGYARWGASAKVALLDEEFPVLRARRRLTMPALAQGPALDFLSLFKTAETITAELELGRLLPKLARLCAEAASAQRAALILDENGLVVRATSSANGEVALERVPLAAAASLPVAVIAQVFHSGERVLCADAAREGPFTSDPYVSEAGVRSMLVLPIRRAERTIGVLYFENNLASHAFVSSRVRLLDVLSSQIAVSIENSFLYEERARRETESRFLSEVSKTLAESLDYESTLSRVAQLAVPLLADWCVVDAIEREGIRRVPGTHVDPTKLPLLRELDRRFPLQLDSSQPAARAMRSGEAYVRTMDERAIDDHTVSTDHAQIAQVLGTLHVMAIPLISRGQAMGAITFVSARAELSFGPREVALGEEIARRAAVAIENARLYKEAQDSIRMRDEFLTAASHELRTPLASMVISVQTLLEQADLKGLTRKCAELVDRQANRLVKLVNDTMRVGRIRLEQLDLHLSEVELSTLVHDVIERLASSLRQAGCEVRVRADGPVRGHWDRDKLDQVVTNLVANAMKFGAGKPIEIEVGQRDGTARLTVIDYGVGIEEAALPHIFNKFERGPGAHSYGGLGLGLYIVRNLVEAMGGTVFAESTRGQATRFTVELPLVGPARS